MMNATGIIYQIKYEASRPDIHLRPRDYRAAVERASVWDSLTPDEKRSVIQASDGEYCLVSVALEDIVEMRNDAKAIAA